MFAGMGADSLAGLSAVAQSRSWGAGEVLFQRGDPGDWLVAIATGRVRLSLGTPGGRELVLRHAGDGDCLGELALLDGASRSADATALTEVKGWVIRRSDWSARATVDPAMMQAALTWVCTRLRETTDQLESIALYDLRARAARFLLFTLRQLHGDDLPSQAPLRLGISQSEIAAVLGASRPKVNRALQELEEAGALVRDAGVITCDVAILADLAEPA